MNSYRRVVRRSGSLLSGALDASDRVLAPGVNRLRHWSLVTLLEIVSRFSILVAASTFLLGGEDRRIDRENRAWQTINTAHSQGGDGGRTLALTALNRERISLAGLRAPNAYLSGIQLPGALLRGAVFDSTTLSRSGLCHSNLWRANFAHADLSYADLRGAIAAGAVFYETNLYHAKLDGAILDSAYFAGATVDRANLRYIVAAGWDTTGSQSYEGGAVILAHRSGSDTVLRRYLPPLPTRDGQVDSAFEVDFGKARSLMERLRGKQAVEPCP
jgi:hypothetical protein